MEEAGGVENLKRPMVRVLSTGPQDRCWQGVARSVQRRRMHRRRVLGQMSRKESGLAGEGERGAPGGNPGPLDTDADQLGRFLGHLWAISGPSLGARSAKKEAQACWRPSPTARGGLGGRMGQWSTRAGVHLLQLLGSWRFGLFQSSTCQSRRLIECRLFRNPFSTRLFSLQISDGSQVQVSITRTVVQS